MSSKSRSTNNLPSAFDLFSPSWEGFKLNWQVFVAGTVIPSVLFLVPTIYLFNRFLTVDNLGTISARTGAGVDFFDVMVIIIGVIGFLASIYFFYPFMYLLKLKSAKKEKMSLEDTAKQSLPLLWRVLGLSICRGFIILVGFVLFIVPGFFMWKRYMLAPYYLIDRNMGIFEALKKSAADSKNFSSPIWGMIGVYAVIALAGLVPYVGNFIGIGMAIAYCCAQALRYLQVKQATT